MADLPSEWTVALQALRERGAGRADPVRLRFIEALAQRAAGHAGAARHALDARLAALVGAFDAGLRARPGDAAEAAAARRAAGRGPLAELAARIGERTPQQAAQALPQLRRTWSRLSARRRLVQTMASVPDQAGPLNSQQLVHRALALMARSSPAYLEHFVAHADALLALERAALAPRRGGTRG